MNELQADAPKTPRRRRIWLRVLIAVGLILALLIAAGLWQLHRWRSGQWTPSEEMKQSIKSLAESSELMEKGRALKADLKELAACLTGQDTDGAKQARARLRQDIADTRRELDSPLLLAASLTPGVGDEIRSVRELLAILEEADEALIGPFIELTEALPLTGLSAEGGLRVELLRSYLDFAEQALPEAEALMERMEKIDLSLLDSEGKLSGYMEKLSALLELGKKAGTYLPAARAILGDGGDRLYLFAAQNSSELRASGGFPGSMGLIRIRDGILTISDFQSVYRLLEQYTPYSVGLSAAETELFQGRMGISWDSDFSPDFERVATIWARAYEARNREHVDGVISGTPVILQRMLAFLGSITLSDGTVLDGENAGRVLGHDLYFRYLGRNQQAGAAALVDDLFSEAAKKTLGLLFSQLNAKTLVGFYSFFEESIADRTLMVWMADEAEQALIREAGWNAGLNADPMRPQVGIFFNSTTASKISWFLNIVPTLSEPIVNEDGSRSYELTVRFENVITPEELGAAGSYILGGDEGFIVGSFYIFAPAGGRLDAAALADGRRLLRASYEGLELGYALQIYIGPSRPCEIRCVVTTAPGAEAPLGLMMTPTMQHCR